jgi:acetyl esterase/lipase
VIPGEKIVAPYGSWPSPISAALLTEGAVGIVDVWVDGGETVWLESRPSEGGRLQIVRRCPDGSTIDVLPDGYSARSAVHEYGGGAAVVTGGVVWFTNWSDQRVYRLELESPDAQRAERPAPQPLTPQPSEPRSWRYADLRLSPDGQHLVAVREMHGGGRVVNELVSMSASQPSTPTVIVSGADFVSSPRFVGADRLRWVQWNHPNMPWDETALLEADYRCGTVENPVELASGQALMQPIGELVLSDASGFWNPWRITRARSTTGGSAASSELHNVLPIDADVGGPAWSFGDRDYAVFDDGAFVATHGGTVWIVNPSAAPVSHALAVVGLRQLVASGRQITAIASYAAGEDAIVRFSLDGPHDLTVLRSGRDLAASHSLSGEAIARGEHITFTTSDQQTAFGWFYPPASATYQGPPSERPPLIVMIHGGPTAAARPGFSLAKQFWTSRGFAVVDVDYRGSTGYGRVFRQLLNRNWGITDVADCCAAATFLAIDHVDPERLLIRGGSAGGFTVLAALTERDVFHAGASSYGVADLAALAMDTHKFESHYTDGLVGPWPADAATYAARSPINHVHGIHVPLIVFQGEDDRVVPKNQSDMIVSAVRANGVRCDYHVYPGEGHGFRRADTIIDAISAELAFYQSVLAIPTG